MAPTQRADAAHAVLGVGNLGTELPSIPGLDGIGTAFEEILGNLAGKSAEEIKQIVLGKLDEIGTSVLAKFRSTHQKFMDHVPTRAVKPERKPTAEELGAAKLDLPATLTPEQMAEAERQAQATFERLDLSKKNLAIWVPGTEDQDLRNGGNPPGTWKDAFENQFGTRGSLTTLQYPATTDFAPSVAQGMVTLQLVMKKIAERGGDHRIVLAGHSQGAHVIADSMADPKIHAMVDKAALFGTPGIAENDYTHEDGRSRDPKITQVDDPNDVVTWPVPDRSRFYQATSAAARGDWTTVAKAIKEIVLKHGVDERTLGSLAFLAAKYGDAPKPERWTDPHHYDSQFAAAAEWLDEPKRGYQPSVL